MTLAAADRADRNAGASSVGEASEDDRAPSHPANQKVMAATPAALAPQRTAHSSPIDIQCLSRGCLLSPCVTPPRRGKLHEFLDVACLISLYEAAVEVTATR